MESALCAYPVHRKAAPWVRAELGRQLNNQCSQYKRPCPHAVRPRQFTRSLRVKSVFTARMSEPTGILGPDQRVKDASCSALLLSQIQGGSWVGLLYLTAQ
jgi:hypothetical protein